MGIKNTKFNKSANKSDKQTQQQENPNKKEAFRIKEGRRFHNYEDVKYFFPNDDDEIDRLHSQHFMVKYLWQGNYFAPIDDLLKNENSKILDLG